MKTFVIVCFLLCSGIAQAQYKFAINDKIINKGFGNDTVTHIAAYVKLYNITLSTTELSFSLEIHLLGKDGNILNETTTNDRVIRQKLQTAGLTLNQSIAQTDQIIKGLVGGNRIQVYNVASALALQYSFILKPIEQQE